MRNTVLVTLLLLVVLAAVVVQARKHEGEGKHLHHGKHDHHHHHGKDKYMENGKKEKHAKTGKNVGDKSKGNAQEAEQVRNTVATESKKKGKEKIKQEAYQQDQGKYTKTGNVKNKKYKEVKEERKEGKGDHAVPAETDKEVPKENDSPKAVPQVAKGKAKSEKQGKQKQGKISQAQKEVKMVKEERKKSKLQKPKSTEQALPVNQPQQSPPASNHSTAVEEIVAENVVGASEVEANTQACKTNADCHHGWCCQSKKGSCQEFKTAVGQKCWDGCMCVEGAVCYLEHQSSPTDKEGKGQLGICKIPEPDDLTMGEYLKMQ